MAPISLPFYNKFIYLGQGSPNVWHSPTLITLQPFVLYITYQTLFKIEKIRLDIPFFTLSFLLLVSCFFKPSYAEVFLPALFIYGTILTIKNKNYMQLKNIFLLILPTIILLILQFLILNSKSHLILTFFGVIKLYSANPLLSFIRATAFPITVAIFVNKSMSKHLRFCWIILLVSYLQFAFLAQKNGFANANFEWGFNSALTLIFIFSIIEIIKWLLTTKSVQIKNKKAKTAIISIVFCCHLASGIIYIYRIFSGGVYY